MEKKIDIFATPFVTLAVSKNTNAFGLFQAIIATAEGRVFKVHANSLNVPKEGEVFNVETVRAIASGFTTFQLAKNGFEATEEINPAQAPAYIAAASQDEFFKPETLTKPNQLRALRLLDLCKNAKP